MKKFWGKYKVAIIIVVALVAFVLLSVLSENANKEETTEAFKDVAVWKEQLKDDEYAVTVIGLTYCQHCHNFNPVITALSKEYDIPLYWFDIDDMSEEDSAVLTGSYECTDYKGSSPYVAVTNKGTVVGQHVGGMSKEATIEFLKESGVIK